MLTAVLAASLVVAGILLEDKLVEKAISQLNNRLDAKINVEKVELSLLRGFPYASVVLHKVDIKEGSLNVAPEFEPGLLSFESVIVRIGLIGILKNEYDIDELILKDGWINLYFDNSGKGNFEIFKTTNGGPSNWLLQLRALKFDNVNISYIDIRTGWIMKGLINTGTISGNFTSSQQSIILSSKVKVGLIKQGSFHYFRNQTVSLQANLLINEDNVVFNEGYATVGKAKIELKGNIGTNIGSPISLNIKGSNIDANYLVSFLSQYNISLEPNIKTKGEIAFLFEINGLNKSDNPFIFNLQYKTKSFSINVPNKPSIVIKGLQGSFTNGDLGKPESSLVNISFTEVKTGGSYFSGTIRMKNNDAPLYHLKLNAGVNTNTLKEWGFEIPSSSGDFSGYVEFLGKLDNWDGINLNSFKNVKVSSNIQFKNFSLNELNGITVEDAYGSLELNNKTLYIPNVTGTANGSLFNASLTVNKPLNLISNSAKSTVNLSLSIDSLNTAWFSKSSDADTSTSNFSIWNRVESISGFVFFNNFIYNNFESKHTNVDFFASKNKIVSNRFVGTACKGSFSGEFSATNLPNNSYSLLTYVELNQLDISELFASFSNFNQSVIQSENISGNLIGSFDLKGLLNDFTLQYAGLEADCNIRIANGRLVNVKQLEGLARFISLDELKDIKFEELENNIRVENKNVIIPRMSIVSSAINLSLSGKHNFDGNYQYRTELLLSDILFSKAKANKPENNEFGQEIDDNTQRTKLFLRIDGNTDDFSVSYDRESARKAFIDNLKQEKQTLKQILRDEFSFLKRERIDTIKNDSLLTIGKDTVNKKDDEKTSTKFTIEWDDE